MSHKLLAFCAFVFIFGSIVFSVAEGASGLATTALAQTIGTSAQGNSSCTAPGAQKYCELPVVSVTGFVSHGVVTIGNEVIKYTSLGTSAVQCPVTGAARCLKGVTRGASGSVMVSHSLGSRVYNDNTGVINSIIGYQLTETMGTATGIQAVLFMPVAFFLAILKMLVWDWPMLNSLPIGAYLKIPLWAISLG